VHAVQTRFVDNVGAVLEKKPRPQLDTVLQDVSAWLAKSWYVFPWHVLHCT
jgi:hypothetical protein